MIYGSVSTNNCHQGEIVPLKASCISSPTSVPGRAELGSAVPAVTAGGIHSLDSEGFAGNVFADTSQTVPSKSTTCENARSFLDRLLTQKECDGASRNPSHYLGLLDGHRSVAVRKTTDRSPSYISVVQLPVRCS